MQLNKKQQEIFESLKSFIYKKNGQNIFLIKGYAGTGKTFLITKFAEFLLKNSNRKNICLSALTNKAVKVLTQNMKLKSPYLNFCTLHSLLGLKEEIDDNGRQIFTNNFTWVKSLDAPEVIFIDEVSMLDENIFNHLIQFCQDKKIKIILVGDEAQIPPVGFISSPVFEDDIIKKYDIQVEILDEIMRQKEGNKIIELATDVRKILMSNNPLKHIEGYLIDLNMEGIHLLRSDSKEGKEQIQKLINGYFTSEEFKKDTDYSRVISWTNFAVNGFNDSIRKKLFGDKTKKIEKKEKLVANKPIFKNADMIDFSTNDEFEVVDYEIKEKKYFGKKLKFYLTKVLYYDPIYDEFDDKMIKILHEDSEKDHTQIIKNLIEKAKSLPKGSLEAKKEWKNYYNFLKKFADVKYSYSMTCHKSQGSTYNTTFVYVDDIMKNQNVFERNRILYTAITRASKNLFLIYNN